MLTELGYFLDCGSLDQAINSLWFVYYRLGLAERGLVVAVIVAGDNLSGLRRLSFQIIFWIVPSIVIFIVDVGRGH